MSYTATSKYGKKITVQASGGLANVEIEGSGDVLISTEDAPALALAILKAAGHEGHLLPSGFSRGGVITTMNTIVTSLEIHVQQTSATEKLAKRRDALAREFAAGGGYYQSCKESLQKAIDRIIELESAS